MRWIAGLGGLVVLAGCMPSTHSYRYLSEDDAVSLVVEPQGRRKAAEGRRNDVFLRGGYWVATDDAGWRFVEDRVALGRFKGPWNPAAIAWTDDVTVNVCVLEGRPNVPATATVRISPTERRTYRITTDCPAFLRKAAGKSGPPKGS